jgi:hypothetical protein
MLRKGLLVLLAITGLSTMAQAQPKIVTLACEGTIKFISSREQTPISASIIIDLTSQTGKFDGHPIRFSSVTDTHVSFDGNDPRRSIVSGKWDNRPRDRRGGGIR